MMRNGCTGIARGLCQLHDEEGADFQDQEDFLAHEDDWLIRRVYSRFSRALLLELCTDLGPVFEKPTRRNRSFSGIQRELADRCVNK